MSENGRYGFDYSKFVLPVLTTLFAAAIIAMVTLQVKGLVANTELRGDNGSAGGLYR